MSTILTKVLKTIPKEKSPFILVFLSKMKGQAENPLQVNMKDVIAAFIGGFITLLILISLTTNTSTNWLIAPFGASCTLAFGVWNSPLSQPRNIIGGHVISSLVGIIIYQLFGNEPWTIALAVGLAIALMMLTKTTHPPAGADPIVVIIGGYQWGYLLTPVLVGSVVIVILALLINNFRKDDDVRVIACDLPSHGSSDDMNLVYFDSNSKVLRRIVDVNKNNLKHLIKYVSVGLFMVTPC